MNKIPFMQDKIIAFCKPAIEYLFYLLFALVPLFWLKYNYELFEFNKMVLTYGITLLIALAWGLRMILGGKISVQRTPLDIPILLFLASQIISTIVSIDIHTSVWGYYSRSNGGLASILSYIFLYYAFVSNFPKEKLNRLFFVMLGSGVLVAFYGVLERGGIDKDYWVQDVQNRVFSTLGQPNWLAAYLAVLIPIAIGFAIQGLKHQQLLSHIFSLTTILFYITLLFTKSRSGFAGLGVGLAFFFYSLWKSQKLYRQFFTRLLLAFAVLTFIFGTPFEQVNKLTLPDIRQERLVSTKPQGPALEGGGTESGKIRQIVWKGAIEIAKAYPLFGSGVETFAYSYYQFRPAEHNQTSEWDFLYNKAHNEYLNYLANTGLFGLGSYLLMIGMFLFSSLKQISKSEFLISKQITNSKSQLGQLEIRSIRNLELALIASYISILVSNFFGFSVVIVNLFFFLIPAFVFVLNGQLNSNKVLGFSLGKNTSRAFLLVLIVISYLLFVYVVRMWNADRIYALGRGLNKAGEFSEAYPFLVAAIKERPGEPIFSEELSTNIAALAIAAQEQDESSLSAELIKESIRQSDYTIRKGPNNPGFWRTRIRVFYTLSQLDEKYTLDAEEAAKRTVELSPTDPKVIYNYGLILGQTGKLDEAIRQLERASRLKPDYRDPVYALGLFYYEKGLTDKAILQMEQVLKFASDDAEATEKLKLWRGF